MIDLVKKFFKDTSGNFAMMFAISIVPLLGFAGFAIDYTNASKIKTKMQTAADSAALSAIIEYHQELNGNQNQIAEDYFNANYNGDVTASINTSLSPGQNEMEVFGTAEVPTTLLNIFGKSSFSVDISSKAAIQTRKLQIAFALDTTGSMADNGKIELLKSSAKDFVDNIVPLSGPTGSLVEFAVVPFSTIVKTKAAWKNKWWLDLDGLAAGDFEGCMWDRTPDLDAIDTDPFEADITTHYQASPVSLYETTICDQKAEILPLSNSRASVKNRIDELFADGNTNTAIGMTWAKNVLSNTEPYKNNKTNTKKIIILLTDGENTESRGVVENGDSVADIDATTLEACTNAKNDEIEIYTIRVIEGNASMIQSCATSNSYYYNITAANQLDSVFEAISNSIWESMISLKQ